MPKKLKTGEKGQSGEAFQLTHPDKIYWPKEKYTKKKLYDYYDSMADVILPYLKNRPESMLRHPDGIGKPGFFQKNLPETHPGFVKTILLPSENERKEVNYLVCQNKKTLLYMVNLGCIEINPWNSRIERLNYPDYAVLDLDPGKIGFAEVAAVAQAIHNLLEKIGAKGYCKTSGKTGLHIFIPLGAKYTNEQSRQFCELLANKIHDQMPDKTSVIRDPKKRRDAIYIDFLQNRIGQTLAAAYSVRPWPGATVSTPLLWKEVNKNLRPEKFTIKNIQKRLKKLGDIWKPSLGKGINMKKALFKLEKL
jgi:bifunctional non-homologous end joining protein LigD